MRFNGNLLDGHYVFLRVCCANFCGLSERHAMFCLLLGLMIAPCFGVQTAEAQSSLTYVSGKGSDSNPCTVQSPCLTLQRALIRTLAGGEVYALDAANAPPTSSVSSPASPSIPPTVIAKNIITDFGATCNGVADDARAFMSFNSWAIKQTIPIVLTIPSGSVCNFASTPSTFAVGIKNLTVSGYGATFTTTLGSFFLGGFGIVQKKAASALIATVNAGTTSITLLTPSQTSKFTVGRYVLLTGGDLQGYGYPPNPWVFEYALVSAIDTATGKITLSAPLQYGYKSTWPSYYSGTSSSASEGGPATLYAFDPSWNTILEYKGLKISGNVGTYANGRSVKFTDVTFNGCTSGGGLSPTQNLGITLTIVRCFVRWRSISL
jgi:hypothetical protein